MSLDLAADKSKLFQVMAVPSGNKPLSEPLLTQFYVTYGITRPQQVNVSALWHDNGNAQLSDLMQ